MEQGERRMTKDEIQKNSEHWYNKYKDAEKRIAELEKRLNFARGEFLREHKEVENLLKENAELKAFINAPLIKGRRTTRKEFYQTIWDLSGHLTKAKELLAELYPFVRDKCYTTTLFENKERQSLIAEAEQFLNSEVEK